MATTETTKAAKPDDTNPAARPPSWVWVLSNEERDKSIHLPGVFNKLTKSHTPGPILKLLPGWNLLDAAAWEIAKRNEQVQREINSEIPFLAAPEHRRECSGKPYLVEGPVATDKANPLVGIEEREARAMTREMFDERLLRSLIVVEKRSQVAQALREAIERIEKASQARPRA